MKKSLHNPVHFDEILGRINQLSENSSAKWGKMEVGQMMKHCGFVLQVPLKRIELPTVNPLFSAIGIIARMEMQIFNNGIPRNMPTFRKLIINFECNFNEEKQNLLKILDEYKISSQSDNLPGRHALFGRMKKKDWGFMEYKHLDHHLKQFNV
ncbi:DUF1569 domain-containing protein [Chryseobacterium sp. JJR-5R]|uniref:DUF1569 domain-containing protein n=1 Tax=Chryseobacterium sp. JJR-5R TaxID=3093923 RepID=UPI002A75E1CD|nr:DUF1569 domain-containing protein [Chryseobacterium sp. JJR-5R]WPO80996.1 DUF1569 domain-containing protein [Chryseobacterium sp. JJR-5R]